jgi:hypothetical protein
MSMRVYTQANGQQRCVQWRIHDSALQVRSWEPAPNPVGSDWAVVAREIRNTDTHVPFFRPAAYGERLIDITLLVDEDPDTGAPPIEVTSSLSGRNTAYGYDEDVCLPLP